MGALDKVNSHVSRIHDLTHPLNNGCTYETPCMWCRRTTLDGPVTARTHMRFIMRDRFINIMRVGIPMRPCMWCRNEPRVTRWRNAVEGVRAALRQEHRAGSRMASRLQPTNGYHALGRSRALRETPEVRAQFSWRYRRRVRYTRSDVYQEGLDNDVRRKGACHDNEILVGGVTLPFNATRRSLPFAIWLRAPGG